MAGAIKERKARIAAEAKFPTRYGHFRLIAFRNSSDGKEHVAVVKGNVRGRKGVPLRMHSECLTGDVFHSLRCDCHAQLDAALRKISRMPRGAVLYLRQEGRGIGLTNKVRAYALQDRGMDTVQANNALGFPSDMRDYTSAAEMVRALGIKSVALITNNPDKMEALASNNILVSRRIPLQIGRTKYNSGYLDVKKAKMRHLFSKR
ncbi:MAG: GTP cyclohydrolase II [Candidatus Micrarchaeia archaeon]|jgi:GTP cyclohydrolase II